MDLDIPAPTEPVDRWRRIAAGRAAAMVLGPLMAGFLTAATAADRGTAYESGVLVFLAFALSAFVLRRPPRHLSLLPLVAFLARCAPVLAGAFTVYVVHLITGVPDHLTWVLLVLSTLLAALPAPLLALLLPPEKPVRAALIGSSLSAEMLSRELMVAGVRRYLLVGVVSPPEAPADDAGLPVLGELAQLGDIVQDNEIELLLMGGEAPRLAVFDELARSCLHLPVRLLEMSGFYEESFGHVPVAEINASWFQYIMHPRYRATGGLPKRTLDVVVAALLAILTAPLIGLLALLVRSDGGPAFFRQERIGESGRPFTLVKLRTMVVGAGELAQWASADDPRTTRVGRILRKSHLDELPQLWNVLRGDMSLVGPRPEQPAFVERLEQAIPFYSRRHLVKPGVTGWAQVRCGYAGSDFGSAWKLCHDLYYLKHRSFWLDCAILIDTLRTLVADPQYDVEPVGVSFILRPALNDDDTAAVAAL
jgi:exopolysaccharide biosynthesis polyprenyl glycosylphosphotransferase